MVWSGRGTVIGLILLSALSVAPTSPAKDAENRRPIFYTEQEGRIAYSADGNGPNIDDIGATPLGLAILSQAGLQNKVVHYDYNSHVWASNSKMAQMTESTLESATRFGFDPDVFIDAFENSDRAYNSLASAINASTDKDPLFLVVAGPMEVACKGILRSEKEKRKYVVVISHSHWNNKHRYTASDCTASEDQDEIATPVYRIKDSTRDIRQTGVWFDQIEDQGKGLGAASFSEYDWLKNSSDANLNWIYGRMKLVFAKKPNPSDAGMLFYLITGNERATPAILNNFFITQAAPLLPEAKVVSPPSSTSPEKPLPKQPISEKANVNLIDNNLQPVATAAVWLDGQLIYSKGDITKPVPAYSISKSLSALVFGHLRQLNKVDYKTVVPNSGEATYAQFLSMSSNYKLKGAPGESHAYNNAAVEYYSKQMRKIFFADLSEVDILKASFMDVIGAQDPITYEGSWSGWGKGFSMSARDYGKVGQLLLTNGAYDEQQIISTDFIEKLYQPQVSGSANFDQEKNGKVNQRNLTTQLANNYSYGWWIVPTAEGPAIAANGYKGKNLIILPAKNLVIVGLQDSNTPWQFRQYIDAILPAIK
ncbi:MAG: hypothetical protein DCF25_01535 [Leptolyngbya foveolarum]|uniref:Uncharacterized protein n=1 Tax=Leptolyngbya foveolarum TaxID=47253 RepID=A0A2W4UUL9_9CYAN|nr:MAG: hypothetical protein DCF25_01535 [Leptolyngbya foveolarum]